MSLRFGKVSEKSNGRIKSYKAKSVILDDLGLFGGIFDPFWAPGDAPRVLPKKIFYSAKLHMKIQLVTKFQKNLMDGSPAISRTHAQTGLITIVPLRLKSGD